MNNPNDEIKITDNGRIFFSDGVSYIIEGDINIELYDDCTIGFNDDQINTFEILKNRKDVKPLPLNKFLQAFKKYGGLALAKYIYLLSKNDFPYNEFNYRTTMRNVKKLLSFSCSNLKFGKRRKRKKVKKKRKVKKKVKKKRKVKRK